MNTKTYLLGFVIVLAVAIGGYFVPFTPAAHFGAEGDSNLTNLVASGNVTVGGNETVVGAAIDNVILANSLVMSNATTTSYTVTSTMTTAQFCNSMEFIIANTSSSITITAPSVSQINAATSTCASSVAGGIQQNVWLNESTNTVTFAPVAGFSFEYANTTATSSNGTTLLTGFTSSTFTLASSSGPGTGFSFYGVRDTSSTFKTLITPYK